VSIRALVRPLIAIALAATLAGCFGGRSTERESESWWDKDEVAVAAPEPAPEPVPEYTVARGDTLIVIAFRRGLDWRELAAWNHIAAPYTIYPDQKLKLGPERPVAPPESTGAGGSLDMPDEYVAPSPEAPVAPSPEVPTPAVVSESGNAETYAVRDSEPAQAASVPPPAKSEPARPKATPEPDATGEGSLTRAMRDSAPPPPAAAPVSTPAKPEVPKPAAPEAQIASAPAPAPAAAPPPPPGPARSAGGASWRWPAQGTLVGRFLPGDPARQGINVQGKPGGIVSAASDGEVVYSGNGLVGYGELIIVKHSGELLSAYGGSGKRLVAEGTKVRSGQPLAELAGNGIVHFEIRRSGKPVDPLEYLPSR
jgi:lipoprotein NlpD